MNATPEIAENPARVLIVDDERHNRQLLEVMLAPEGFRVLSAGSGEEALATMAQCPPDLILMDIMMPGMDGYQLVSKIKANLATKNIPIIMISALGDREARIHGLDAGAEDFLTKPVDRAELRARVKNLLRLKAYGDFHEKHGKTLEGEARLLTAEQQRLEEQLRQAQKLEMIGQLAGGIAHDFNNLLTAILGFSEVLISDLRSNDAALEDVLEIKKAGERAAGLTRQLLAFSRKQILQPNVLDINDLIKSMESLLRRLISENVNLVVSLQPRVAAVKVDPTQLEQILVNLAVNAADAMPRGGKLTIETANVTLDEHYRQHHLPVIPGDYVMLAVSDTGAGMDEETSQRIFEPFFTTKAVGKGTGLGLATVYGIVKQSGGDIWVYSEPGRGSTFKIYLPQVMAAMSVPVKPVAPLGTIPRGSERILVVEDDEAVRRLARLILERAGYRVLEAESPLAALHLANTFDGPIDLLLSDVIMPDSDGPPLFLRLAKIRPHIRVLYMSGYADEAILRQGVIVEGTPFLQKPFTPIALARKVRDVLDAPRPIAPLANA